MATAVQPGAFPARSISDQLRYWSSALLLKCANTQMNMSYYPNGLLVKCSKRHLLNRIEEQESKSVELGQML
jgi:hypothetical protein